MIGSAPRPIFATSAVIQAKSASLSRQLESGSSACASKPALTKMASGWKARTAGRSSSRHARRNSAEPDEERSGAERMVRWRPVAPRSSPVPGKFGTSWEETYSLVGSGSAMSASPFPWWTSKSRMATRPTPCTACACATPTRTLFTKQKPWGEPRSAWCPGGRTITKARREAEPLPAASAPRRSSTARTTSPAARSTAALEPGLAMVSESSFALRKRRALANASFKRLRWARVCTRRSCFAVTSTSGSSSLNEDPNSLTQRVRTAVSSRFSRAGCSG
mmetsp:Transcript_25666/g.82674  ORF Transcript_25666/g.82674 Transcript_25666/m.82674 type:complete len:278 (-) Transcript_25666:191-1024(-)